jgi:hypothetical protein
MTAARLLSPPCATARARVRACVRACVVFICSFGQGYIASNLEQLKMDHVDLLLIHFDRCESGGSIAQTWKALTEARTAGQALSIGVSHFTISELEAMDSKPDVNQCSLSVKLHDDETIEYCREHDITCVVRGVAVAFPLVVRFAAADCGCRWSRYHQRDATVRCGWHFLRSLGAVGYCCALGEFGVVGCAYVRQLHVLLAAVRRCQRQLVPVRQRADGS